MVKLIIFFGKQYRLEVVEVDAVPCISFKGKSKIVLSVKPKASALKREEIMQEWHRQELRIFFQKKPSSNGRKKSVLKQTIGEFAG